MEWLADALGELNYWSVLLAGISTMIVGSVWYSPKVMGKTWMKEAGLSNKDMENKDGMATNMIFTFIFSLLAATGLGVILYVTGTTEWLEAVVVAALVGLVFTALPNAVQNMFGMKSYTLSLVQGGEVIIRMSVMGLILGLMA